MRNPEGQSFESMRPAMEGAEAVYMEPRTCALVRLKNIEADDWGVKAQVELIADLASERPVRSAWNVGAAWGVFSFRATEWHTRYVGMHIYMDGELVRTVKAKAKELEAMPIPLRRMEINRLTREPPRKALGAAKGTELKFVVGDRAGGS